MLTNWIVSVNIYPLVLCWCSTVVVQLICNQQVGGSNPSTSSKISYGGIPEWPKGADCKSVVNDFGGSNPPSPTKTMNRPKRVGFLFLQKGRWIRKGVKKTVRWTVFPPWESPLKSRRIWYGCGLILICIYNCSLSQNIREPIWAPGYFIARIILPVA